MVQNLQGRLKAKHKRGSDEGEDLRALREIRVQASPSWDADRVDVFFWSIQRDDEDANFDDQRWEMRLTGWMKLIVPTGRFQLKDPGGIVTTIDDMTPATSWRAIPWISINFPNPDRALPPKWRSNSRPVGMPHTTGQPFMPRR